MVTRDLSQIHELVSSLFELPRTKAEWDRYRLTDEQVAFFHEQGYVSGVQILSAAQVDVLLDQGHIWGYLIEGHGLYAWGRDMKEARRHLEAFEFLINCELEMRKLHR